MTPLVVAALAEEVAHAPSHLEVLVTGVGKVRAAAALARRLADGPAPETVVNVGTAGALEPHVGGLVEISYVTQHDFPYDEIEALVGEALPRGYVLAPDRPPAAAPVPTRDGSVLATGDRFVSDADAARRIAAGRVHLVDMEGYGYATVCAEFAVPFRCVKAVSDAADEAAADSWLEAIDGCARSLGEWLARTFPAPRHIRGS